MCIITYILQDKELDTSTIIYCKNYKCMQSLKLPSVLFGKEFLLHKFQKFLLVPREFINCLRASFPQLEDWLTEGFVDDNENIYAKKSKGKLNKVTVYS